MGALGVGLAADVRSDQPAVASTFALHQNYPNPFNPSTTITYDLPVRSNVRIAVYDVLGRQVAELFNGARGAGRFSQVWNASGVASGMYFVTMRAGSFAATQKMILMK